MIPKETQLFQPPGSERHPHTGLSAAVLVGALLHSAGLSYLYSVSYFLGRTSAGSISQAPGRTALGLNLANGWYSWVIGGQERRKQLG